MNCPCKVSRSTRCLRDLMPSFVTTNGQEKKKYTEIETVLVPETIIFIRMNNNNRDKNVCRINRSYPDNNTAMT
jgi:hypothetical protein